MNPYKELLNKNNHCQEIKIEPYKKHYVHEY